MFEHSGVGRVANSRRARGGLTVGTAITERGATSSTKFPDFFQTIRAQSTRAPGLTSLTVVGMEKKLRATTPRVRGHRVMFASLLILGMFLMQAFCHNLAAVEGSSPQHHRGMAQHLSLTAGDSVSPSIRPHEDATLLGISAALSNESFNAHSVPNVFTGDPCSTDSSESSCSADAVTSCLLILFLSVGLLIPQTTRVNGGSSRFIMTTTAPVRFLGNSPNLHALGISRT